MNVESLHAFLEIGQPFFSSCCVSGLLNGSLIFRAKSSAESPPSLRVEQDEDNGSHCRDREDKQNHLRVCHVGLGSSNTLVSFSGRWSHPLFAVPLHKEARMGILRTADKTLASSRIARMRGSLWFGFCLS